VEVPPRSLPCTAAQTKCSYGRLCFDLLEVNWRDLRGQRPVQRPAMSSVLARARGGLLCFNERFPEADALLVCVSGRIRFSDATSAQRGPR
jgi:hypothetical protein